MKKIIRILATPFVAFVRGAKRVPILRRIELLSIALYSVIIVIQAIKAFDPSAWWVLALPLILPLLAAAVMGVFYFVVVFFVTCSAFIVGVVRMLQEDVEELRDRKHEE